VDILQKKLERIIYEIKQRRKAKILNLLPAKYIECEYKKDNILPPVTGEWDDYLSDTTFGGADKHYWIYKKFQTESLPENGELRLSFTTGFSTHSGSCRNPQSILYVNGSLAAGLDINHCEYVLKPNEEYEIYIYLYTGSFEEKYGIDMSIISKNLITEKLYYDMKVPYDAALCYNEDSFVRREILKHLSIASDMLDMSVYDDEKYYNSAQKASEYLKDNFFGKYPEHEAVINCIGHTHIDVAWLWTYAQTREKAQRSFSTVLRLMERYPEYKFTISQPQLLEYLKEEAPEVYEEIRAIVKSGRIEVEGAMWVEADCNIPSGESLIRQIMFGKKFIKDEFDKESNILWLPDVFGYSAALPQILKKTGVDRFVTSKISWNEFNKLPYDIFVWKGIDGSEVITHFISGQKLKKDYENKTITNYNGDISPEYMLGTWDRFQQKEYSRETFLTYGYGDGGGGPTEEMLEVQRRISQGILGLPKSRMNTAKDTFSGIEKSFYSNAEKLNILPKWRGELYLEFHRGTYTTIGKVKRYNRKCEILCQSAEKYSVINSVLLNGEYPKNSINSAWKKLLLNQFHDVIPGSSISKVYEDSFKMYAEVEDEIGNITENTLCKIAASINTDKEYAVFNPNPFETDGVVCKDGKYITVKNVPSLGWKAVELNTEKSVVSVSQKAIENMFYKVVFGDKMDIVSIYDKINDREIIKENQKAELRLYEDLPYVYDAWDVSVYHKHKYYKFEEVVSVKAVDEGARAGLEITRRFDKSYITQRIYLYNSIPGIEFDTMAEWHQRHLILKAAFPLNINADKAIYDIQFGNIERTHTENTSWDIAKFETCAHKWADFSDGGYGVALMNDCKYGYSVVEDSTLQLSLIRGSDNLGDGSVNDQGEHIFKYSLLPHSGGFRQESVPYRAMVFNNPLKAVKISGNGVLPYEYSMIKTDNKNIVIDTVKKAEKSEKIVVRFYENYNKAGKVKLDFGFDIKRAYICDMLENAGEAVPVCDNSITINVGGYEIITLMIE